MKIGITGDTHGFYKAWRKAYDNYLSKTDLIFHLGDILYCSPGYNPITSDFNPGALANHLNNIKTPIIFCRGDNDSDVDQKKLKYPILSKFVFTYIDGFKILLHHGEKPNNNGSIFKNFLTPDEMEQYAKTMQVDIFIMGRTHKPIIKKQSGIIHINPGSPVPTVHDNKNPSVGIFNTKTKIIKIVSLKKNKTIIEKKII